MSTSLSLPLMRKVHDTLVEKGLTGEILQKELLGRGRLSDLVEAAVCGTIPDRDSFRKFLGLGALLAAPIFLSVNYGRMLDEMITAGCYDWINIDITAKRFPITGTGVVESEAHLVHFGRDISTQEAERLIKASDPENPWELGKIEHLLAFGEGFPEEQSKYPIVALGSVAKVDGSRGVPCLNRLDSLRAFGLEWHGLNWSARCRFLTVRKKVSGSRA